MATVLETKPALQGENRFLLTDISWDFYLRFCEELEERHVRLTYDRGSLEIMVTGSPHEFYKKMLAKLLEQLLFELNVPVRSGGEMTFQREDLQKGFEHDECWWIAHERQVRGRRKFDFRHDPPPGLALEIEITSSLVNRLAIFAALRVPEVWRFDGQDLRFVHLQDDGSYAESPTSLSFPFLRPEHLTPYLKLDSDVDETTLVRQFVEWLREQDVSGS